MLWVMTESKTWEVGVELSEDHLGPLRFVAALAQPDDRIVGLHVMPEAVRLHPLSKPEHLATIRAQVESDVALLLERAGASSRIEVEEIGRAHV